MALPSGEYTFLPFSLLSKRGTTISQPLKILFVFWNSYKGHPCTFLLSSDKIAPNPQIFPQGFSFLHFNYLHYRPLDSFQVSHIFLAYNVDTLAQLVLIKAQPMLNTDRRFSRLLHVKSLCYFQTALYFWLTPSLVINLLQASYHFHYFCTQLGLS